MARRVCLTSQCRAGLVQLRFHSTPRALVVWDNRPHWDPFDAKSLVGERSRQIAGDPFYLVDAY